MTVNVRETARETDIEIDWSNEEDEANARVTPDNGEPPKLDIVQVRSACVPQALPNKALHTTRSSVAGGERGEHARSLKNCTGGVAGV